jgi:malto-oligosyltrehalose trehalohydrolase
LTVENEKNQARYLARDAAGNPRWYAAQWNDDAHHVLHTAATGESHGYYAGFRGDTRKLGGALAKGFVRPRGEASGHLPPKAFVAFLQNHDQIGNRAQGERLGHLASGEAVRAVAATYLLLPQIPMLFMGEEWNAAQPFLFFCDFGAELAEAVRAGRRAEFAQAERVPDPQACETFAASKLQWSDLKLRGHAEWLEWYRRILRVRRKSIVPLLPGIAGNAGRCEIVGDGAVVVTWRVENGADLTLAANLSDAPVSGFPAARGRLLWREGEAGNDGRFGPWAVRWSL